MIGPLLPQEVVKRVVKVCRDKGVTPGGQQHAAQHAAQQQATLAAAMLGVGSAQRIAAPWVFSL